MSAQPRRTPQQAHRHLARLSRAQRKNPNRPLVESFNWRRAEAMRTVHAHVLSCIQWGNRKRQYGECEASS